MHPSLSPSAVHRVLLELAHVTRVHDEYLGRLTPVDISAAYQRALGGAPDDSGRQMLARLCMLGRLEQESADRQFIDVNVIDVLRAERLVIDIFRMEDDEFTAKPWKQPLRITGLVYAASQIDSCDLEPLCLSYIGKFGDSNNRQKLAELISALATLGPGKLDLRGLNLANIEIPMLTLGFREIANLVIKNSIIGVVGLENSKVQTNSNLFLESCLFTMISGISGSIGLPAWIIRPEVIEYDGLTNVSRIRDSSVSPEHKFFLSIIHKIFFQAGAGREEASLMKGGFGQQFNPKIVESILKLLTREGLIEKGKGDDGFVYRPVRRHTERMARIKAELSLSADVLWEEIGKLKH